ncbi:hypothetical protein C8F04DRAFT_1195979 [Mycena alexandri]|uniref:Uncharacterized protein n=1 Tax=Mycena alexandri TaxID=1745969 RepID=A0AAD6S5L5_9AGAR|nr:hypothetical protein C8F04DRAFT_1195979 [Mycena alexandri]
MELKRGADGQSKPKATRGGNKTHGHSSTPGPPQNFCEARKTFATFNEEPMVNRNRKQREGVTRPTVTAVLQDPRKISAKPAKPSRHSSYESQRVRRASSSAKFKRWGPVSGQGIVVKSGETQESRPEDSRISASAFRASLLGNTTKHALGILAWTLLDKQNPPNTLSAERRQEYTRKLTCGIRGAEGQSTSQPAEGAVGQPEQREGGTRPTIRAAAVLQHLRQVSAKPAKFLRSPQNLRDIQIMSLSESAEPLPRRNSSGGVQFPARE